MITSKERKKLMEGLPVTGKPYHSILPDAIGFWHCNLSDCGHNVLAILKLMEKEAFSDKNKTAQFLCPVPVIAALESHKMQNGFIIVDHDEIDYSPVYGLSVPSRMDEY